MSIYLSQRGRAMALITPPLLALAAMLWIEPIGQDPAYHNFVDRRAFFAVPNAFDVLSNGPFLLVGLLGLWRLSQPGRVAVMQANRTAYGVFFLAVACVSLGSAWYHLNPNNDTLMWDRLPMTVAFMAFFSIVIGEYIDAPLGRRLLWPLVLLGLYSIAHWRLTGHWGQDDLRVYALVQFLPMLLIPLMALLYEKRFTHGHWLGMFIAAYAAAKWFEWQDAAVYNALGLIAGHAIKHLLAALGVWCFLHQISVRRPVQSGQTAATDR